MAPLRVLKRSDRPVGSFKSTAAWTSRSPRPLSRTKAVAAAGPAAVVTPAQKRGSDCSAALCTAGAADAPNPPGEGWACGDPPGQREPPGSGAGSHTEEGQGGLGPRQLPLRCWHARSLAAPLPKVTSLPARSGDGLFWPGQFLSFHTKLQTCSAVGWHFSPCRLWSSHREAIYQRCVCIQSPGLSAAPPVSGRLRST